MKCLLILFVRFMRRDSAFGVGALSLKGGVHSTSGSIDDTNYIYSQHQKRVSNASSQSFSITQQASQTSRSSNSSSASHRVTTFLATSSRFHRNSRAEPSRDNLPRYQQPLSPQQQSQLQIMENNKNLLSLTPRYQTSRNSISRKSLRVPFLKSPVNKILCPHYERRSYSGQAKDKDCIIC